MHVCMEMDTYSLVMMKRKGLQPNSQVLAFSWWSRSYITLKPEQLNSLGWAGVVSCRRRASYPALGPTSRNSNDCS